MMVKAINIPKGGKMRDARRYLEGRICSFHSAKMSWNHFYTGTERVREGEEEEEEEERKTKGKGEGNERHAREK